MNHNVVLGYDHIVYRQKWALMSLHELFFFCLAPCVWRKNWHVLENLSQKEIGPSCSWQDLGSFLCLSRKCKKSDFSVFHARPQDWILCLFHMFSRLPSCLSVCLSAGVCLTFHTHRDIYSRADTHDRLQTPTQHLSKVFYTPPELADIAHPQPPIPSSFTFLHLPNFLSVP